METEKDTNRPVCTRMVLSFKDSEQTKPRVEVDRKLLSNLKPHQVEGWLRDVSFTLEISTVCNWYCLKWGLKYFCWK